VNERLDVVERSSTRECLLELHGEIDMESVEALSARTDRLVAEGHGLTLDLAGVEFIDSSGLRLLIGIDGDLRRGGQRLVIRRPSPPVQRILQITALERWLQIEP
jgi:anti-sigma B factor antagonist